MSPARRWFERALSGVLLLLGLCFVAPAFVCVRLYVTHMYTVGLSCGVKGVETLLTLIVVAGVVMTTGGVALMRRT